VTDAFLDGASAVFAATSNALGTFTVTHAMASLPRPMANLTVQSGHLTLTGDPLDWGSAQRVVDVGSNATLTLACTITNTSGGLWKTGAGTLILAASNTITGDAVMGELAPGSYGIIRFTCNHGLAGPEKRIWQPTTQSTSTSTVELVSSVVVSNIHLESAGHGAPERPHLHSVSGTNVWGGDYRIVNTGGFYPITCTSGRLVFNGNFDNRIGSPRIVEFHGDGDFVLTGGKYESGTRSLSLRMNGTGTWTLNGSFTGIGGVLVTTGRVVINGSAQSIEPSRVGAGALLSGTGSVSYLQVSGLPGTNAVIDPGGGDVGTLSASTLQLSNATYRCDFANGAADRIDVDHLVCQGPWRLPARPHPGAMSS
jgi:autotransporter-associated beta strand protein